MPLPPRASSTPRGSLSRKAAAVVSRAGYGKPGYCKLCAFSEVGELNAHLKEGWNARQINDWLNTFGTRANRQTIYAHKSHITDPQDKLVAYAERAPVVIKNSSTEDFLQALQDIGFSKAVADPESVTIDHALKAAQIKVAAKKEGDSIQIVLAQVFTGRLPHMDIVEGEAREV